MLENAPLATSLEGNTPERDQGTKPTSIPVPRMSQAAEILHNEDDPLPPDEGLQRSTSMVLEVMRVARQRRKLVR